MEKIKQYKYIMLIALLLLGFVFYWFEFRPYLVKKDCYQVAYNSPYTGYAPEDYSECLKRHGI